VKIIAVSGLSQQVIPGVPGGTVFLHKPYTSEKLLETVSKVLKA